MSKGREIFLFGAGAVIDWNALKTDEITDLVRKSGFTLKNSETTITEFIYLRLIEVGYADKDINFETIINVIEELLVYYSEHNKINKTPSLLKVFLSENDLCQIFNYSIEGGIRKHGYRLQIPFGEEYQFSKVSLHNENPNQFFLQHLLSGILISINNTVSKYSWNTNGYSVIDKASENSLNFRRWIKNIYNLNIVRLYTLNYDNLFKVLLKEEEINCFDGFFENYIDDYYSHADIAKISLDTDSSVLYNLHGSSYWKGYKDKLSNVEIVKTKGISLVQDSVFAEIEKGKTIFVSNIITGYQKTQKSAITPFRQMQSAFDRDCLIADKITIVGYSFNDEHINESIRAAYKYNDNLKIEIIEPNFITDNLDYSFTENIFPIANEIDNSDSEKNKYSYFNGRIIVFTMYFSDFLKLI